MTRNTPSRPPRSLTRKILTGGAWALTAKLVSGVALLLTTAVLARLLAPAELGVYFLGLSVASVGGRVARLGLDIASVRFIPPAIERGDLAEVRALARSVLGRVALAGLVAAFIIAGSGEVLGRIVFRSEGFAEFGAWFGVWALLLAVQATLGEIFRGLQDIRLAVTFTGSVLGGASNVVLTLAALVVVLLSQGTLSLQAAVLLTLGANVLSVLAALLLLTNRLSALPRGGSPPKDLARVSSALWLSNVSAVTMMNADLWIVGITQTEQDIAVYGAAGRLVKLVPLALVVINEFLVPMMSQLYSTSSEKSLERILRSTAGLAAMVSTPVIVVMILASPQVMALAYGPFYSVGGLPLAILSSAALYTIWCGSVDYALAMTGQERALMTIMAVGTIVAVVVAFPLARNWGIAGVAAAFGGTIVLQRTAMVLVTRRRTGILTVASPLAGWRKVHRLLRKARG